MDDLGTEVPPNLSVDDRVPAGKNTPGFSGDWKDMAKDIALLSAKSEMVPVPEQTGVAVKEPTSATPAPAAPEQPKAQPAQPPAAAVTVPEKFQAPDGSLDQERIVKSYLEAEKQLKRLQNQPLPQVTNPANGIPATLSLPEPNSFEAQVYHDFLQSGLDQRSAAALVPTITKLFAAASDSGYARAMGEVSQFKQSQEELRMREELKAITLVDPSLVSPEGIQSLIEIRQQNPWINSSPEPWKIAWSVRNSNDALKKAMGAQQVNTPNPKAATAQTAPVSAVAPHIATENPTSAEDIKRLLSTMTDEQKGEFFKRNLGRVKW